MTWAAITLTVFFVFFPKTVGRHLAEIVLAYRSALSAQERDDAR